LKFKADFHSNMSVCRHELGVQLPNPLGSSNPASIACLFVFTVWRFNNANLWISVVCWTVERAAFSWRD